MKMVFNSHRRRSFNHIPEVAGSMESEWAMFRAAIAEAAAQSCGSKVTAASHGGNSGRLAYLNPLVPSLD